MDTAVTAALVGAVVAGPVALAGSLVMRWFELSARKDAWAREDRQRFLEEKRRVYSTFLADCHWHVVNRKGLTPEDHLKLTISQNAALLLAPKEVVPPVQDFLNQTLKLASSTSPSPTDQAAWGQLAAALADAMRADLGSDTWSTRRD